MENLYDLKSTVLSRTTYIFNKNDFSDVVLIVGEQQVRYQAHKLLLSLASPVFAHSFEEMTASGKIVTLPIPDVNPAVFYIALKYIYTDEVELNSVREARNILRFAEKFKILALQQICKDYIRQHGILPENAIKMFETAGAAMLQMSEVQELCLYTFSEKTIAVFESAEFLGAQQSTVETIIKIDALTVDSEMDILNAVLKWGEAQCRVNDLPIDTKLRGVINPLLGHIRFLTISLPELQAFWRSYKNLMTSDEVCALAIALVQSDLNVEMPETVCPIKSPRNTLKHCTEENLKYHNSVVLEETAVKQLNTCLLPEVAQCVEKKETMIKKDMPINSLSNGTKNFSSTVTKSANYYEYNCAVGKLSEVETSVCNLKVSTEKNVKTQFSTPLASSLNLLMPSQRMGNLLTELTNHSAVATIQDFGSKNQIIKGMKTSISPQKRESDSESDDENESGTSESDTEETFTNCKKIEIELDSSIETPHGMRPADITSNITINVIKGLIKLLGLRIQMRKIAIKTKNNLSLMVRIENDDKDYEKMYNEDASSPFDVFFDKPLHILAGKKVKITVSIEDVQLRQCFLYRSKSSFDCGDERGNCFEIQISGNQGIEEIGLPFFISGVLYRDH